MYVKLMSKLPRLDRAIIGEFIRFAAIGLLGLFVDLGSLWFAINILDLNPYVSRVFSFVCAATFTWACNRAFTFRDSAEAGLIKQWAKFLSVNALGGLANFTVFAAVLHQFEVNAWGRGVLDPFVPYIGVAVGAVVGLLINFTASKKFIFG